MNVGRTITTAAVIAVLTLVTACADTDAPEAETTAAPTTDQATAVTPESHDPKIDFYRAQGLPELYGSLCEGKDRAIIGIEYTHSFIKGETWRASGDPNEEFMLGRGRYGENLRTGPSSDYEGFRLIAYDYYVRGQPGELVILGRPGSTSSDRCMIGILTDEALQR